MTPAQTLFVLSGSQRAASLNTRLAHLVAQRLRDQGVVVEALSLTDVACPTFDQDEEPAGPPPGAERFKAGLEGNDAFVIVSPEYNASMPGGLKNAIDWVSRLRPQPFHRRHGLLLSASPSMVGGNRGLWSLRVPLEHLGARVYPDMFSLAQAHQAFDADGGLANAQLAEFLDRTLAGFCELVEADTHYPCVKTAWIEHLGEAHTDATGRIDL